MDWLVYRSRITREQATAAERYADESVGTPNSVDDGEALVVLGFITQERLKQSYVEKGYAPLIPELKDSPCDMAVKLLGLLLLSCASGSVSRLRYEVSDRFHLWEEAHGEWRELEPCSRGIGNLDSTFAWLASIADLESRLVHVRIKARAVDIHVQGRELQFSYPHS